VSGPRLETCYLAFDASSPPFDDVRVRLAFAAATDREALADVVLQGYVSPATGGLGPPGMPGHTPGIGLSYDPRRARRLLAEAGYPDGRGFPPVGVLAFRAVESRGDYLASQWRDVLGVETQWDVLPWAAFLDRLGEGPPQILVLMWVADYPDPDSFMRVCRDQTWPAWPNERYDHLVERARRAMGQEERMELYEEADRLLVEEAPILPLTYERDHLLIKRWVRRYPTSPMQAAFWKDAVIEPH
jgi:ABC-type transport system substrate-binding protein